MKHFNPDFPKKSIHSVTIYGNVITLTGTGGTANITINGILNTAAASFVTDLAAAATAWVTANYSYYYTRGFIVSAASGVITVLPRYGWETVNKINASIANATTNLSGTVTGTCKIDTSKAKVWRITFGQNITMQRPVEPVDSDRVSIEFINSGSYTVTWATNGFYFAGGTEPTVTVSSRDVFDAVFQGTNTNRVYRMTLSGSSGTGNISMAGVTKEAEYDTNLTTTAAAFVTANADAYLAAGITLTSSGAVLIFTTSADTKYKAPPTFTNVTLTLAGAVAMTEGGRWLVTNAAQNIIQ
jgi:hypothetical protein